MSSTLPQILRSQLGPLPAYVAPGAWALGMRPGPGCLPEVWGLRELVNKAHVRHLPLLLGLHARVHRVSLAAVQNPRVFAA